MIQFLIGLLIFLGVHSIAIVNEPWRDRMASSLGTWTWKGLYSLVSLVGFIMLVRGYGDVRLGSMELYSPPLWLQHLSLVLLLPVFPLLVAAYVPGRIKQTVRHPMLLATKLWATAHLLANGTLVDVILFVAILAWAVLDRISVNRRPARALPGTPPGPYNDIIALVLGLGLYLAFFFWLHELLIGVPPV